MIGLSGASRRYWVKPLTTQSQIPFTRFRRQGTDVLLAVHITISVGDSYRIHPRRAKTSRVSHGLTLTRRPRGLSSGLWAVPPDTRQHLNCNKNLVSTTLPSQVDIHRLQSQHAHVDAHHLQPQHRHHIGTVMSPHKCWSFQHLSTYPATWGRARPPAGPGRRPREHQHTVGVTGLPAREQAMTRWLT